MLFQPAEVRSILRPGLVQPVTNGISELHFFTACSCGTKQVAVQHSHQPIDALPPDDLVTGYKRLGFELVSVFKGPCVHGSLQSGYWAEFSGSIRFWIHSGFVPVSIAFELLRAAGWFRPDNFDNRTFLSDYGEDWYISQQSGHFGAFFCRVPMNVCALGSTPGAWTVDAIDCYDAQHLIDVMLGQ